MILGKEEGAALQKTIMRTSRKQEERSAKNYKGSRQPGSGSGWARKNDVRSHDFLIENKFTGNEKSYTIKFNDLKELTSRAVLEDRTPMLQFDLGGRRYVVLVEDDFLEMLGND